jgi:ubiquinone/menaquinone biosynthesis C-methylase UbiE
MEDGMSHERRVVDEFTHQSERFNVAPVMSSAATLQTLVDFLPLRPDAAWLEVACGPGIVSRALAPRVGSVLGLDLTPAMVEVATREAARAGLANVRFATGDATALDLPAAGLDGAVTRFSLHHIPLPGRVVGEMARVVRPGGWVCLADHVTSADVEEYAWHQAIERLRDPSHWACLTPAMLRGLGARAGLVLRDERQVPFSLDFEEWLSRGSGGPAMRDLIARALADRPAGTDCFRVLAEPDGRRRLHLIYHLTLWQRLE